MSVQFPKLPREALKELALELSEGIVVLLDALGARNYSEEETASFLIKRNLLLKALEPTGDALYNYMQGVYSRFFQEPLHKPDTITFGDTILFSWRFPIVSDGLLLLSSFWAIEAISKAMELQLPLRGAVACGKFLLMGTTVLGPAVAEAASWYEKAAWIGAVATPSVSIRLEILKDKMPLLWSGYIPYNVPGSKGEVFPAWAVAWPWAFIHEEWEGKANIAAREDFLNTLKMFDIPHEAANKYFNTLHFFDHYYDLVKPRYAEYIEEIKKQAQK